MTQELFTKITDWQKVIFPKSTPLSKLAHLKDELNEVEHDIKQGNQDLKFELADCFFLIFGIADQVGITHEQLTTAIAEKLQINQQRKWQQPNKDGVVFHVKD